MQTEAAWLRGCAESWSLERDPGQCDVIEQGSWRESGVTWQTSNGILFRRLKHDGLSQILD